MLTKTLYIITEKLKHYSKHIIILGVILIFLSILHLSIGKVSIGLHEWLHIFDATTNDNAYSKEIILYNRIPTILTAIIAGAALAISGMQMQILFRNPVAGPFVLGISSGASLFVALFLMSSSILGIAFIQIPFVEYSGIVVSAFIGSILIALVILYISRKVASISTVLIVGLLLSGVAGAIVTLLESIADKNALQSFVFWSFGSFQNLSYMQLIILAVVVLIGLLSALPTLKASNLLQINDAFAQQNGVPVQRTKTLLILSSTILASAITAYCGPIAFVGLAVPHACRSLIGSSNNIKLFPVVLLMGSIVCVACSIICNIPFIEMNIPINVITSMIGGPVVIYMLIKKPIDYK